MWNLLLVQRANGEEGSENGIAIVRTATAIEPTVANDRRPGIETFHPSGELGLLVQMPVHQYGVIDAPGHFDEEQRTAVGQAHDLDLHSGQRVLLAPALHQIGGPIHVAMLRPLRIEVHRLVRDADVIAQGRDDRFVPYAIDIVFEFRNVHQRAPAAEAVQRKRVRALFVVAAASAPTSSFRARAMVRNTCGKYIGSLRRSFGFGSRSRGSR